MIRTVARYVGAQLMRVSPFFVWIVFRANRLQVVTIKGMHRENSVARPFDDSNACAYIVFQNVAFTPIGAEERYNTDRTQASLVQVCSPSWFLRPFLHSTAGSPRVFFFRRGALLGSPSRFTASPPKIQL